MTDSNPSAGAQDDRRRQLGRRGEDAAAEHLIGLGYRIVDRNWRCRSGEIDLIARCTEDGRSAIVFCEVKTRTGLGYGGPLQSITYAKGRRLRQLAGQWLAETGEQADDVRIDAVGVLLLAGRTPEITHIRGIDA
jgi:putative endonuclease